MEDTFVQFKPIVLLVGLLIYCLAACTSVQVDLSNPEIVCQEFMQNQAKGNRRVLNSIVTKELRNKLQEQKLYLYDREEIRRGSLDEKEIRIAWDEVDKKVYQLNYTVKYTIGQERKKLRLKEAISLIKTKDKWYIDDYVPDLK